MKRALITTDTWTSRKKKSGFLIPKGWVMPIAEWSVDIHRENEWTVMLMPKYLHDPKAARKEARDRADRFGRRYEMEMALRMVKAMAELYGRRFPDLVQPDRTLLGFDPAQAVHVYIPYRTPPGRDGDREIRQVLENMAFKARRMRSGGDSGSEAA